MSSYPLRVAVVGAGPAGLYAAEALVKGHDDVVVDLIDRLPTPYGLVRYGVAPDHQKIKSVTRVYERTGNHERVRFLGNVEYGRDITHEELRAHYHAVIYSVGAASDRNLDIPGEQLSGSHSATEFVAWYNGHPDYVDCRFPLNATAVAVIGLGNVAVDVTRILAKSVAELELTDIADHALPALADSNVEDIYMLGRRGPAQGKFTTKELRELGELVNADIVVDPADMTLDEASTKLLEESRAASKNVEILRSFSEKPLEGKPRRVHLRFLVSPVEILGDTAVEAIVLERNRLEERDGGYLAAVGTGEREVVPAQLVLRSVGYRGVPLPGVPFDDKSGTIPHELGRVLDAPGGVPIPGAYVAGWIKRGPTGVIGTNKADAMETVGTLLEDDLPAIDPEKASPEAIDRLLEARGVRVFTFDHWRALDEVELTAGEEQGRPRVKVTTVRAMLEQAGLAP